VSIVGLLLVISRLDYNGYFGSSTNRLATTFKFLLVFIFTLDAITPSISNAFFILYITIIMLIPLISPEPEYIANNIEVNDFIIKMLDELKKQKTLKKSVSYKVIKEIMKYE